jgi:DNA-binding CsgD family transcriptional regulator
VRDLLTALGTERRTVLVVEDLHWSDLATRDLLTFLVRAVPPGVAVVLTSRLGELAVGDPLLDWLADVSRLPTVETVALSALPPEESLALVAALAGPAPADSLVDDVLQRGQGSPFFIEQLVAAARAAAPAGASDEVPAGIGRLLGNRLRSVSGPASEVAAALAVAGRPLSEPELAACIGAADVAPALRELVDARLVAAAEAGRYRLRHALLEDTVRSMLLASQRARLHAAAGAVLAARGTESAAEVAVHFAHAGDLPREAHWSVAAARQAEAMFAWAEASAAWRRVWQLWSALSEGERPDVDLAEAVVGCVKAAAREDLTSDRSDSFLELAREALADDRIIGDDYATARLLDTYARRLVRTDKAAGTAAMERAVALFERVGRPSVEHARAIGFLVMNRIWDGSATGREDDELARAVAIAEECGDLDVVLNLTADQGLQLWEAGRVEDALAVLAQALARAVERDAWGNAVAPSATHCYLWLLRLRDGVDAGRAGIALALRAGERGSLGFFSVVTDTAECLVLLGEIDAATALVDEYQLPELTVNGYLLHLYRAELDVLSGDYAAAIRAVERLDEFDFSSEFLWLWLAEIGAAADLWRGRAQSARDRVGKVMGRIGASRRAVRAGRMMAFGAWAAADLADADLALDREELAQQLHDWADAAECFGGHPGRVMGVAYGATFEAELARLRRTGEEAAWRVARDMWASHDVPHHAAYAGWRLAERLVAHGRRKEAETELAAAYAAAERHVPLRQEIEGLAQRARLALPVSSQGASVEKEPADHANRGLTSREIDVLRLLGTGATNAEIGRRLYMSPKTASVHVSAIIRKLGVNGRVQAATVAERMGLLVDESGGNGDS